MPVENDAIKVVIRFKGREELSEADRVGWEFMEDGKGLYSPECGKEGRR